MNWAKPNLNSNSIKEDLGFFKSEVPLLKEIAYYVSQVGLMNQFSKQTYSDLDETWSKNQAYDEDAVAWI